MFQSFRMIRREARKKAGRPLNYNILHEAQGTGRKAQGVWCHVAAPSLGHDASLSFVVRGRGQIVDFIKGQMNKRSERFVTVSFSSYS